MSEEPQLQTKDHPRVKNIIRPIASLLLTILAVSFAHAQQPAAPSPLQKNIESYLRRSFALGPDIQITVAAPAEIGNSGLLETNIDVKTEQGTDKVKMYITKDGRYLLRGEISDLSKDPLAENISKLDLAKSPVLGDPKAAITIVEFADFECPVCRNLHDALRGLLPKYPQVKLIFKDFPIDQIHPWARTASLAGRCSYQQDPAAFWKFYDFIYDKQDLVSAANVYDKVLDFAGQANLNQDTFKACLASPQATSEVDASLANGNLLEVRSTPTLFVNGRRLVGADPHGIQQYIDYELAQQKAAKK
jgi:protein-disulfide isomerase